MNRSYKYVQRKLTDLRKDLPAGPAPLPADNLDRVVAIRASQRGPRNALKRWPTRVWRGATGKSQRQIAEALGVSQSTVNRLLGA